MKNRLPNRVNGYTVTFLFVLTAGVVLRFYGILDLPLIEDALYTLRDSAEPSMSIRNRPLYYLLQIGVFRFLPVTHFSMRLLPLIFGVLGIMAIWAAGNRLFGPRAALISATLVAFSPWHIYMSQIGRYWSLVFLEAVLLFWALGLARETRRPSNIML